VERGVRRRTEIRPSTFGEPIEVVVEFNRSEEADMCAKLLSVERHDAFSVRGQFESFEHAHRTIWALMALSAQGINAQF
jgi:D-aminopeptidase